MHAPHDRFAAGMSVRPLWPINVPAIADLHHEHEQRGVLNLIDDAVIPDADTVKLALALHFQATRRTGIGFESAQRFDEAALEGFIAQPLQKLGGRGRDCDPVAQTPSRFSKSSSETASPVCWYSASD